MSLEAKHLATRSNWDATRGEVKPPSSSPLLSPPLIIYPMNAGREESPRAHAHRVNGPATRSSTLGTRSRKLNFLINDTRAHIAPSLSLSPVRVDNFTRFSFFLITRSYPLRLVAVDLFFFFSCRSREASQAPSCNSDYPQRPASARVHLGSTRRRVPSKGETGMNLMKLDHARI